MKKLSKIRPEILEALLEHIGDPGGLHESQIHAAGTNFDMNITVSSS